MGLQTGIKFNGRLNVSNFTWHGIPDKRSSIEKKKRFPNVLVLTCGRRRVVESDQFKFCTTSNWICN